MTDVFELIKENRSFRRFSQEKRPAESELLHMIDAARLSPSAGNLQRLRFTPVFKTEECRAVFDTLAFAAYFGGWRPREDEAPTAYIVIFAENEPDTNLAIDAGIASQSILLTARAMGYGGCIFRSIKKPELVAALGKDGFVPAVVIALGTPSENVRITAPEDGSLKYYRDSSDTHCVPKKSLGDIII